MKDSPIGVIDSGVGGLSVLKQLENFLPDEDYIYVCDEKNVPYGKKSSTEIKKITWKMINFLMYKKVKAIVIGCNTITAVMLTELKEKLTIPVYGVIYPGCINALDETVNKRIGVIGTQITIRLNAYSEQLKRLAPAITVFQLACQDFVKIAENLPADEASRQLIVDEMSYFDSKKIDTLILGCTHFPLIYSEIKDSIFSGIKIIDPALETAKQVESAFGKQELHKSYRKRESFYTSGNLNHFQYVAGIWLDKKILMYND